MSVFLNYGVEFDFATVLREYLTKKNVTSNYIAILKSHENIDALKTVIAWVESGFNKTKTAEMIYVHKNTMQYRLDKINDILNLDVTIPKNAIMLYLCMKCEEVLQ